MTNLSKTLADGFRKARIHRTVLKPPVVLSLEEVGFALAVAAGVNSVDGRRDSPHLRN